MSARNRKPYDRFKRLIDVSVAAVALVATAPVQAALAIVVRRNLGSPVLFRQRRPGRDGRPFDLVKFRTMRDVDLVRGLVTDEERLTPFGQRLRRTSLDELPTLWNVLRGDMSLIGPRPLLMAYLDRYTSQQARRHEVRPGVTGLAQASGRNEVPWEDRFALDVEYVDNRSLRLDAWIAVKTILQVLTRTGVSEPGHVTMTEFGAFTVDDGSV
ncbi:lipopolysaccharide/colanic/teichoic acid biosynthesis glycosyltransferase [Antricoccus suffuscus]|uniref:Lipopolysaccharide/colanic/teichoic acid biosynthesis glycosyltransferase n=1 Tax=Antricoccus suffuscus TaxID=1629062 RepID=A0A2T1A5Z5_9ACTN|nr:sugar transferase [Antricoccus suffuscus]PRZ44009.1 lipopolysaccharide/colanic/teichoic acid biosynthesis glycosyltransferase [Antricoccus suffuscus]